MQTTVSLPAPPADTLLLGQQAQNRQAYENTLAVLLSNRGAVPGESRACPCTTTCTSSAGPCCIRSSRSSSISQPAQVISSMREERTLLCNGTVSMFFVLPLASSHVSSHACRTPCLATTLRLVCMA